VIWWIRSFGFYYPLHIQSDGGVEFAASVPGSFKRNPERVFKPLGVTRSVIRKGHPEDNVFVERSHRTDDQEFYIPYLLNIKNEKDLIERGLWWQKIYNLERPHQGLGNLASYEKLKSLGYATDEALCLFPPLILDYVCCLDPFIIKKKGVQDHLDHDREFDHLKSNRKGIGCFHTSPKLNCYLSLPYSPERKLLKTPGRLDETLS